MIKRPCTSMTSVLVLGFVMFSNPLLGAKPGDDVSDDSSGEEGYTPPEKSSNSSQKSKKRSHTESSWMANLLGNDMEAGEESEPASQKSKLVKKRKVNSVDSSSWSARMLDDDGESDGGVAAPAVKKSSLKKKAAKPVSDDDDGDAFDPAQSGKSKSSKPTAGKDKKRTSSSWSAQLLDDDGESDGEVAAPAVKKSSLKKKAAKPVSDDDDGDAFDPAQNGKSKSKKPVASKDKRGISPSWSAQLLDDDGESDGEVAAPAVKKSSLKKKAVKPVSDDDDGDAFDPVSNEEEGLFTNTGRKVRRASLHLYEPGAFVKLDKKLDKLVSDDENDEEFDLLDRIEDRLAAEKGIELDDDARELVLGIAANAKRRVAEALEREAANSMPLDDEEGDESGDPDSSASNNEFDDLEAEVDALEGLPEVHKVAKELLKDLKRDPDSTSENWQVKRSRLRQICKLPWLKSDDIDIDLEEAKTVLDSEHYGLEKVKQRIIEYLAVQKRNENNSGTFLCLVGPPGVGKTTLAESIAKAAGRKFVRIALGGVHDEPAIRGHNQAYVGADVGKIAKALTSAGVNNPVVLLDEIEKVGTDSHNGNPADALLEVLDPSQNKAFVDHFIDLPFDLSNVMFIASANSLDKMSEPLQDRLEIIELSSYTPDEKFVIAKKYLVPKNLKKNGVKDGELSFTDKAIKHLISHYTYEAGVREVDRVIDRLCRKVVTLNSGDHRKKIVMKSSMLATFLDPSHFIPQMPLAEDTVGHTQGLYAGDFGGGLTPIEVKIIKKISESDIIMTGHMGDVMKESVKAALTVAKKLLPNFGHKEEEFADKTFHIHFYDAATPKEGPSAGLAITTTLISAMTDIPVRRDVCMTGEINLSGKSLPIGGLKEKLIGAHRAGMTTALIPRQNESFLVDVPDVVKRELEIIMVDNISEVLEIALRKPEVNVDEDVQQDEDSGGWFSTRRSVK